jgi:hypothetical protein
VLKAKLDVSAGQMGWCLAYQSGYQYYNFVENEMEKEFFNRIVGSKYDRGMTIVFIVINNTQ